MLIYYITDRRQLPGGPASQRAELLERISAAARAGVDFIQLREKDLSARELELLAREAVRALEGTACKLLVNGRSDIAVAAGAHGVHLPAGDIAASDARTIFPAPAEAVVAVSCHSAEEVAWAEAHGADFAVFGAVFEKDGSAGVGLAQLRRACAREEAAAARMPVLALGGVTAENAAECAAAGAQGVAGIRLFQEGGLSATVARLRGIAAEAPNSHRRHAYQPKQDL